MQKTTLDLELLINLDEHDSCLQAFLGRLKTLRGVDDAHLVSKDAKTFVCFHVDPNIMPLSRIQRVATEIGIGFTDRFRHIQLPVTDLNTADAAEHLSRQMNRLNGVVHAHVNYAAGLISVAYDSEAVSHEEILATVKKRMLGSSAAGVSPEHRDNHSHDHGHSHGSAPGYLPHWLQERWTMTLVALAGLCWLIGAVGSTLAWFSTTTATVFYLLAYLFGAYDIASHAIPGLFKGKLDTDILMLAAAAGAAVLGQFAEGAFLLFLFALGHAGEHYALDKARSAVNALADLMPKQALKRDGDHWQWVDISILAPGDEIRVRAGDKVPADGAIVTGKTHLDQSAITGESAPIRKAPGDAVYAGSINQEGVIEVAVSRLAEDSTLGRIMRMVAEAQSQQSPTQQITQRFTARFVPTVLIAVVLLTVIPPVFGWMTLADSFYRSMLLLVASSPCALAIGTPAAMLAGIAQAARNGVLIKGGVHLESLGRLHAIAFDKTGTLTQGRFQLLAAVCHRAESEQALLTHAAALEAQSNHPLATALMAALSQRQWEAKQARHVENHAGFGLSGEVDGLMLRIGKPAWFDLPDALAVDIAHYEQQGHTLAVLADDTDILGVLVFGDQLRDDAASMLSALADVGIQHRVMLTGDNRVAADQISEQLGITDVKAELLPDDKLNAIDQLKKTYGRVAMVGDGVNDAPALAQATVGIGMGGAGTDVALETADVVLMSDQLGQIPFAVRLSQFARRIVKQNLAIALGVIGLLIVTSVVGVVDLSFTVILHEGSTLVVVLNALRLLKFR